ncbi:MAG: ATP-binding protein [Candidatus Marinimicrobia bacterium]|jgi:hypothetical protein|nr:ATP-binding protein [Candidatus Neomarinimicrobiota bacterium]MBT4796004.1 ATP-binding protein [Candidatus Neomarinimicrobiota bacterium]MBT5999611.1 ATP-binding protein [Candidatus Neomarinimicrobiota bacterium]MBT6195619.1 ATP-binding protein [Candidatus Neomarinimicrobiota bacterium]
MNPFLISVYKEPSFFCNREKETKKCINAVSNQRNLVIYAIRRMGKTGLIHHVFYQLQKSNNFNLFYIDIDQTNNLNDFLNTLINGLIKGQKKSVYGKLIDFIKQLRPTITFDPNTGYPEIKLNTNNAQDSKASIESVLNYLESLDKPVIIAIDEFQRITDYPEKRVEAFLRSHIQHLNNVTFIFSGSKSSLLQAMFSNYNRPFYQSAELMHMERLHPETYCDFIMNHFSNSGKTIHKSTVELGINWADNHTFYVQYLFNTIWGNGIEEINTTVLQELQSEIIESRSALYANYRNLLTHKQFRLLKGIAMEGAVEKPNSNQFIQKYNLGSASTVNSALKTLRAKELIYSEDGCIKLYDVFQSKWFQQT